MLTHKDENFTNVQKYMKEKSMENSRMSFMIRCEMVLEIEGNLKTNLSGKGEWRQPIAKNVRK